MGENIEFNWILKLKKKDLEGLTLGETREFSKEGKRIYPLDFPVLLADEDWHFHGYAHINDYQSFGGTTTGKYSLIRELNGPEEQALFGIYRDLRKKYDF